MTENKVKTIADIAKIAGVSKSTVSRALSNSSLISQTTRDRIHQIAKEHNFHVNQTARRLSEQRSHTLAFVTYCSHSKFSVEDLFSLEILGAITTAAAELKYDLLMVNTDSNDPKWIHDYYNSGRVDGFILMTSVHKIKNVQQLLDHNAPFITWGNPFNLSSFNVVTGDDENGGYLAAQHLINSGRSKIGFIGGPAEETEVKQRFQGYTKALLQAGLQPNADWITHASYTSASSEKRMTELLQKSPDLDAIFCNSDMMAIGAMRAIQKTGRRIPEDIAVVGYDDVSMAQFTSPPLTTIRQNIAEIGRQLVINLVNHLETGIINRVTMPIELIKRQST